MFRLPCCGIIGILLEKIEGAVARSSDLDACARSLEQLHKIARHGDLNRWNIIVTQDGPNFIDLEESELRPTEDNPQFDQRLVDERVKLKDALKDDSGIGSSMYEVLTAAKKLSWRHIIGSGSDIIPNC